jgi:hypothetical protein
MRRRRLGTASENNAHENAGVGASLRDDAETTLPDAACRGSIIIASQVATILIDPLPIIIWRAKTVSRSGEYGSRGYYHITIFRVVEIIK